MNQLNKKTKTIIGLLFMTIGIGLSAGAILVLKNPIQTANVEKAKNTLIADCKRSADLYQYEVTNKSGVLEVNTYGLEKWESDISKFSIIMTNCNGFTVTNFCMGNTCKSGSGKMLSGTTMTLTFDGKLKNIVN